MGRKKISKRDAALLAGLIAAIIAIIVFIFSLIGKLISALLSRNKKSDESVTQKSHYLSSESGQLTYSSLSDASSNSNTLISSRDFPIIPCISPTMRTVLRTTP